jgi:teichuronic acid biosynthesis glycosyltransferase TuaG
MSNVSVIIPMYKCSSTIRQTLNSILVQSSLIFEIILVLDGYDPEIEHIVTTEFAHPKLILIVQDKNSGVASARNAGLKLAKSEFIAFCDADDVWHPKKLEIQLKHLKLGKDLVGTSAFRFSKDCDLIGYGERLGPCATKKINPNDVKIFNPFYFSSIIIRNTLINDIKFNENTTQEDYQFIIDIFKTHKNAKAIVLENQYIGYRVLKGSRSGTVFRSTLNSLKIRTRNFGLISTIINFPLYAARVLKKRYRVTF